MNSINFKSLIIANEHNEEIKKYDLNQRIKNNTMKMK